MTDSSNELATRVMFVLSPKLMPNPNKLGRTVLIDLAFAHGHFYRDVTVPFIAGLGERLAAWIDHHPHPAWPEYRDDPRFVLVEKQRAPACPELVTPERVEAIGNGVVDLMAHADFDGCIGAAKFLRGGQSPYPEADEDARAIDAPGGGFTCSPRGKRLSDALDQARVEMGGNAYRKLIHRVCLALVAGHESSELAQKLDELAAGASRRFASLEKSLRAMTRPHPEVVYLRVERGVANSDRKALLRMMEEHARVAVLDDGHMVTVATFDEEQLDVSTLPALDGGRGLAWGPGTLHTVLGALAKMLRSAPAP